MTNLGFQIPLFSSQNQDCTETGLSPPLGRGKYEVSLKHFIVSESQGEHTEGGVGVDGGQSWPNKLGPTSQTGQFESPKQEHAMCPNCE